MGNTLPMRRVSCKLLIIITFYQGRKGHVTWHTACKSLLQRPCYSGAKSGKMEFGMSNVTLQDWTESSVTLKPERHCDVRYRVYREDGTHFLEIHELEDDSHIHTLELPNGMKLHQSSYEVLLRYVLLDIVAA